MADEWSKIDTDRARQKYSGRKLPRASLSTTNPTWTDRGLSPAFRSKRLADNSVSHGTALLAKKENLRGKIGYPVSQLFHLNP
jgi:hypothetical protein